MKQSLQQRLTLMLGVAILVSGFIAGTISFFQAYKEAKEFQDDTLHQIAYLFSRTTSYPFEERQPEHREGEIMLDDNDSRIGVIHIPGDTPPAWFKKDIPAGWSTLDAGEFLLRVFVLRDPSGETTVVTQPIEVRNETAIDSAFRTFAPMAVFLPLMAWLIVRIVKREFTQVRELAGYVDSHQLGLPPQLPATELPLEIQPFIHAINRLLKRLGRLMQQQNRFVADAAHELRSPLAALTLQVQNLDHAESPENLRERVQTLQDGLERARKLSEQLLNLARIQAGSEKIITVNLSTMSRALIADFLPAAESKKIDLGLEEKEQVLLEGTEEHLYLLLKNALDNALQYTENGGQVTIRLISTKNTAGFEVIDNGPGIPISEQDRVLDPFYRVSGSPGRGSGLGLAIASEAAACLGGSVSLLNREDGTGLIFRYVQERFEGEKAPPSGKL
jgi:two-component system OmpR family sensor kinase